MALCLCLTGSRFRGWTAARSSGDNERGAFYVNDKEKAILVYAGEKEGSRREAHCLNTEDELSHFILKIDYEWVG